MNLAGALKKLYTKLGGTDALPQGTDTCALVDKIADEVSGGGSSGGGTLLVTETWSANGNSATLDKTYNQIVSALNNGQVVLIKSDISLPGKEETHLNLMGKYGTNNNRVFVAYSKDLVTEYLFESTSADGVLTYTSDIN